MSRSPAHDEIARRLHRYDAMLPVIDAARALRQKISTMNGNEFTTGGDHQQRVAFDRALANLDALP